MPEIAKQRTSDTIDSAAREILGDAYHSWRFGTEEEETAFYTLLGLQEPRGNPFSADKLPLQSVRICLLAAEVNLEGGKTGRTLYSQKAYSLIELRRIPYWNREGTAVVEQLYEEWLSAVGRIAARQVKHQQEELHREERSRLACKDGGEYDSAVY